MRLRNLALFFGLFLLLFLVFAQLIAKSRSPLDKFPPLPTASASGQEMYMAYCAECHGRDGKGGRSPAVTFGAAAPSLTTLSKMNHGRFPYGVVKDAIRGDYHGDIYGPGEMPPWGFLFRYVGGGSDLEVQMRINRLTEYLRSLQEK
jgi:mono/diheme cytochrome c family protein